MEAGSCWCLTIPIHCWGQTCALLVCLCLWYYRAFKMSQERNSACAALVGNMEPMLGNSPEESGALQWEEWSRYPGHRTSYSQGISPVLPLFQRIIVAQKYQMQKPDTRQRRKSLVPLSLYSGPRHIRGLVTLALLQLSSSLWGKETTGPTGCFYLEMALSILDLVGSQNPLLKDPECTPGNCPGLFCRSVLLRACHAMDVHVLSTSVWGKGRSKTAVCRGADAVWTCRMDCPHSCGENRSTWLRTSVSFFQQTIQMVSAGLSLVT